MNQQTTSSSEQPLFPTSSGASARRSLLDKLLLPVDGLGAAGIVVWNTLADTLAFTAALIGLALRPGTWRRTVRRELIRQCYLSGVTALPIVGVLGLLVGTVLIAQSLNLFRLVGQGDLVGDFMALVVFREVTPVLIGLVIVGRSGAPAIAEIGTLLVNRQMHTLDSVGVDPVVYLVLPRVMGMAVAACGLAMVFVTAAFFSGFLAAYLLGFDEGNLLSSAAGAASAVSPLTYLILLAKSLIIGTTVGVLSCRQALTVTRVTDLPRALSIGFMWSVFLVFTASGLVTLTIEVVL